MLVLNFVARVREKRFSGATSPIENSIEITPRSMRNTSQIDRSIERSMNRREGKEEEEEEIEAKQETSHAYAKNTINNVSADDRHRGPSLPPNVCTIRSMDDFDLS